MGPDDYGRGRGWDPAWWQESGIRARRTRTTHHLVLTVCPHVLVSTWRTSHEDGTRQGRPRQILRLRRRSLVWLGRTSFKFCSHCFRNISLNRKTSPHGLEPPQFLPPCRPQVPPPVPWYTELGPESTERRAHPTLLGTHRRILVAHFGPAFRSGIKNLTQLSAAYAVGFILKECGGFF